MIHTEVLGNERATTENRLSAIPSRQFWGRGFIVASVDYAGSMRGSGQGLVLALLALAICPGIQADIYPVIDSLFILVYS